MSRKILIISYIQTILFFHNKLFDNSHYRLTSIYSIIEFIKIEWKLAFVKSSIKSSLCCIKNTLFMNVYTLFLYFYYIKWNIVRTAYVIVKILKIWICCISAFDLTKESILCYHIISWNITLLSTKPHRLRNLLSTMSVWIRRVISDRPTDFRIVYWMASNILIRFP